MDVPFVALRKLFDAYVLNKPRSYRELVAECRETAAELPSLVLKLAFLNDRFAILINQQNVPLPPADSIICDPRGETAERRKATEATRPPAPGPNPRLSLPADESRAETALAPRIKVGRDDPCPCGSGKKYKKCCKAV
jgi:hypothetical protein